MRARSLIAGLLAAVTVAAGASPAAAVRDPGPVGPMIVGGDKADQPYPFATSIQYQGRHICGASLVAASWVVTAAHCMNNATPDEVTMRIGSPDHTTGGELRQAAEIKVHPKFGTNPNGTGADIALIRLTEPSGATPIAVGKHPAVGTKTRILGWGQTCSFANCGGASQQLQQLNTTVVDPGKCNNIDSAVELCTKGDKSGSGACYGDSGGPEIVRDGDRWLLVGATSRAGDTLPVCATAPTVYTSVPAYADWISTIIANAAP